MSSSDKQKMVGWYDPGQLLQTAGQVVVSTIFGKNSDQRMIEALFADVDPVSLPDPSDPRLINYVLGRPDRERVGKVLIKEAMRGLLPDAIVDRTDKRGFPVPFVEWAQGPLRDFIGDRIGYIPDPEKPWDRKWWVDLCQGQTAMV